MRRSTSASRSSSLPRSASSRLSSSARPAIPNARGRHIAQQLCEARISRGGLLQPCQAPARERLQRLRIPDRVGRVRAGPERLACARVHLRRVELEHESIGPECGQAHEATLERRPGEVDLACRSRGSGRARATRYGQRPRQATSCS